MTLSGSQYEKLVSALTEAFPTPTDLEMFVRFRLGQNLYALAGEGSIPKMAYELVRHAEANGLTAQLVMAARASKPHHADLAQLAGELGLSALPTDQPAYAADNLERTIRAANGLLDLSTWRVKLAEIENRVCRIEIACNKGTGQSYGTGFLVGPDLLMTNYHVLQPVIELDSLRPFGNSATWAEPGDVICRFDYKTLPGGHTVNAGVEYRLAANWLVDASPLSPQDLLAQKTGYPQPDQLDYALVRLAGEPGNKGVGLNPEPGAPKRGWFDLPATPFTFTPNSPLVIVQHPQGAPVKLGLDTDAIIAVNGNGTRVTYKTNTEPGSSGSPCLDINLNLVALHHAGDPNFNPAYNEGVPIAAIRALLSKRGKLPGAGASVESLTQPTVYHTTIQNSSGFAVGEGATVVNNLTVSATPPIGQTGVSAPPPVGLSKSARRRLEQRRAELAGPLETYNRRVAALLTDISREPDSDRKAVLEIRLTELKAERDKLQAEVDEIDDQLA